jgi:twinkle protein
MINEFLNIGINPKGNRSEQKVTCPNCLKIGKTNYKDTCLSINLTDGLYHCHKCGWSGCVKQKEFKMIYTKPTKQNFTKLSDEALKLFTDRGITQSVVNENKIVMSKDGQSVIFPYLRNGELINYKQRFIKEKDFRQAKDAEAIMFNYDRCKGQKEIIVCEGEFDCLAFEVAGFTNVTSVNQGAPNVNDKNIDKKLECITNSYELFENAEKIYIATDNDENGRRLKEELIRRFGAEKCSLIDFNQCKDANDYLLMYGKENLKECVKQAQDVPIDGIFTLDSVFTSMLDTFRNGKARGTSTYWDEIDCAFTWRSREVTVWTGYQNEGKSLFLESLCVLKAFFEGWKFAVFSPENTPVNDFYDNLIEIFIGKSSDPHFKANQMTESEYVEASEFISNHFFMIYPDKDFELNTIFEKTKYLIRKQGVRCLIIDPYNTVEHKMKSGEREDLYISRFMSEIKRFSIENDITTQLVAHQVTPQKDTKGRYLRPDVNRIKGGGTFADKADNVLFVWRPERALDFGSTEVIFGSQKIKKQKLVGIPQDICNIQFQRKTNRYYINGESPFDKIDRMRNNKPIIEEVDIFDSLQPNTEFDNAPF